MITGLAYSVEDSISNRFRNIFDSKEAILAAITSPKFKLQWIDTHRARKTITNKCLLMRCIDSLKKTNLLKMRVLHYKVEQNKVKQVRKKIIFMNSHQMTKVPSQMPWK